MNRRQEKSITPFITTDEWISFEMKRYVLETETPGRFGYFGVEEAAA